MLMFPYIANLLAAMLLGALIGAERQWRQRMAGLRTNALVATGAAVFTPSKTSADSAASSVCIRRGTGGCTIHAQRTSVARAGSTRHRS